MRKLSGMLIGEFYKKLGEEALPVIAKVMGKRGKEIGHELAKNGHARTPAEFGKMMGKYLKSDDKVQVKMEHDDRILTLRYYGCGFDLDRSCREICDAMLEFDKGRVRAATGGLKVKVELLDCQAAGNECCEVRYTFPKKK